MNRLCYLPLLLSGWLMTGCGVAPLALHPKSGLLETGAAQQSVQIVSRDDVMLPSVHVRQYLLMEPATGSGLVYEHAVAATGYEFDRGVLYSVDALFEAKRTAVVAREGGYLLLRVLLYDGDALYVVTAEGPRDDLKLLYASDIKTLWPYYRSLSQDPQAQPPLEAGRAQPAAVRTQWNFRMLFLKNILSRQSDGLGMLK